MFSMKTTISAIIAFVVGLVWANGKFDSALERCREIDKQTLQIRLKALTDTAKFERQQAEWEAFQKSETAFENYLQNTKVLTREELGAWAKFDPLAERALEARKDERDPNPWETAAAIAYARFVGPSPSLAVSLAMVLPDNIRDVVKMADDRRALGLVAYID